MALNKCILYKKQAHMAIQRLELNAKQTINIICTRSHKLVHSRRVRNNFVSETLYDNSLNVTIITVIKSISDVRHELDGPPKHGCILETLKVLHISMYAVMQWVKK